MDFARFPVRFSHVIDSCSLIEMHSNRILSRIDLKFSTCIITSSDIQSDDTDIRTFITGGGDLNNLVFSVNSLKRNVADMMINFRGFPFLRLNGVILDNKPIRISV